MDRVDILLEIASRLLSGSTLPVAVANDEIAMDFLAERDDFMAAIEERATIVVGRPSRGPGDGEFEKAMVNLMDTVQSHLDPAWLGERYVASGQRPNSAAT